MMFEADFIPLSALQHYAFCPRQCALIHVEQLWMENAHTAEGRVMHETAHSGDSRTRDGVRIVTDLPLSSRFLGVSGMADVVEFHREGNVWIPFPVEYKKGAPKNHAEADAVQVCAQAICLEEMLGVKLTEAAIYYGAQHHRHGIALDATLRDKTAAIARATHKLFTRGQTPPPERRPHCKSCSLAEICMPDLLEGAKAAKRADRYLQNLWNPAEDPVEETP